jgi:hypothetical protein
VRKSGAKIVAALLGLSVAACASYMSQQDELAMAYLKKAQAAVAARDATTAIANLNQAETAWLGGATPYRDPQINIDPEALREVARARQAVEMGLWSDADYYVRTAMTHPSTIAPLYPFYATDRPLANGPAAYTAAPAAPAPAPAGVPAAPGPTGAAAAAPQPSSGAGS